MNKILILITYIVFAIAAEEETEEPAPFLDENGQPTAKPPGAPEPEENPVTGEVGEMLGGEEGDEEGAAGGEEGEEAEE